MLAKTKPACRDSELQFSRSRLIRIVKKKRKKSNYFRYTVLNPNNTLIKCKQKKGLLCQLEQLEDKNVLCDTEGIQKTVPNSWLPLSQNRSIKQTNRQEKSSSTKMCCSSETPAQAPKQILCFLHTSLHILCRGREKEKQESNQSEQSPRDSQIRQSQIKYLNIYHYTPRKMNAPVMWPVCELCLPLSVVLKMRHPQQINPFAMGTETGHVSGTNTALILRFM